MSSLRSDACLILYDPPALSWFSPKHSEKVCGKKTKKQESKEGGKEGARKKDEEKGEKDER